MTIQQLRYFITVANQLHFGEAAKLLYIAQPALSYSISSLEAEIGVQLFNRTSRSVELTPAGKVFLQEAKEIIRNVDDALQRAKIINLGYYGNLCIGLLGGLSLSNRAFTDDIFRFRMSNPYINVNLIITNMLSLHQGLLNGSIDIALTRTIDIVSSSQSLVWKKLNEDRFCLFVRKDHPLANCKYVNLSLLHDESFVMLDQNITPHIYQHVLQLCSRRGLMPNIVQTAPTLEVTCTLVRAGLGIAILPKCAEEYCKEELIHIEIEGNDTSSDVVLAWNKIIKNNSLYTFLNEMVLEA